MFKILWWPNANPENYSEPMRAREVGNSVHAGEGHGRAQGKVHPEALTQSLPLPGGAWYPQQPHLRPPPHPHTSSSCFGLLFRILKPEKGQGEAVEEPLQIHLLLPAGVEGNVQSCPVGLVPCGAGAGGVYGQFVYFPASQQPSRGILPRSVDRQAHRPTTQS